MLYKTSNMILHFLALQELIDSWVTAKTQQRDQKTSTKCNNLLLQASACLLANEGI